MQERTIKVIAMLALLAMVLHDLWREYQVGHSTGAVLYWAAFYTVFWGYVFYCYRKYN